MKRYHLVLFVFLFLVGCKKNELTPQQEALKREVWNSPNYTLIQMDDNSIFVVKHPEYYKNLNKNPIQFCLADTPCVSYPYEGLSGKILRTKKIIRPTDKEYPVFAVLYLQQR